MRMSTCLKRWLVMGGERSTSMVDHGQFRSPARWNFTASDVRNVAERYHGDCSFSDDQSRIHTLQLLVYIVNFLNVLQFRNRFSQIWKRCFCGHSSVKLLSANSSTPPLTINKVYSSKPMNVVYTNGYCGI